MAERQASQVWVYLIAWTNQANHARNIYYIDAHEPSFDWEGEEGLGNNPIASIHCGVSCSLCIGWSYGIACNTTHFRLRLAVSSACLLPPGLAFSV